MILGIDPSLTHTGLVVLDDGKVVLFETIETFPKEDMQVRLMKIRNRVGEIMMEKTVDCCVLEGYAYSSRAAHSALLHELGGILKMIFHDANTPFYVVSPLSLKKFATGQIKSDKNVIMKEVLKRWGFDSQTDHEADAFVLAKIGEYLYDIEETGQSVDSYSELNLPQKEVLKNIIKKASQR